MTTFRQKKRPTSGPGSRWWGFQLKPQQRNKQRGGSCIQFPAACCFHRRVSSDAPAESRWRLVVNLNQSSPPHGLTSVPRRNVAALWDPVSSHHGNGGFTSTAWKFQPFICLQPKKEPKWVLEVLMHPWILSCSDVLKIAFSLFFSVLPEICSIWLPGRIWLL